MKCKKTRPNTYGFTLIELLVVISIIALLLSILMPAMSRAKGLANKVVCGTNMKQIGLSFNLYTQDYANYLPPAIQGDEGRVETMYTWDRLLEPYVDSVLKNKGEGGELDTKDVFGCPGDRYKRVEHQDTYEFVDVRRKRSYSMVTWDGKAPSWHQPHKIFQARSPSQRLLTSEWFSYTNVRWLNWHASITHGLYMYGYPNYDVRELKTPAPYKANYHGKGSNFLYLDFHVDWLTAKEANSEDIWGWDTTFPGVKKDDSGFDFD